jgi:hypothetical protein
LTRATAFCLFIEDEPGKRLSGLALSEVEGVNLEPLGLSAVEGLGPGQSKG